MRGISKVKRRWEWDKNIGPVLFAYRTKKQETSGIKPGYLVYGREIRLPTNEDESQEISMTERLEELIEELPRIRYKAKEEIGKNQDKQKEYYDKKGKENQYLKWERKCYIIMWPKK